MPESSLSFNSTATFRNNLMGRNLVPYTVPGAYSPPSGNVNYEVSPMNDSSVIDSPNDLIGTTVQANQLYSLNEYGPEGGYNNIISTDGEPLPVTPNQGEYGQNNAQIDLVNEFYIDSAYIKNSYGPEGGYKDLIIITDNFNDLQYFSPYATSNGSVFQSVPINFLYSIYSPFEILTSSNPTGNPGPLSQDSLLAQIGAKKLKEAFEKRIADEVNNTINSIVNLDSLQDPFEASLVASGQQPIMNKNWKITVPDNPLLAAVSLTNRLTGTYFPVSLIPGDYFTKPSQGQNSQTQGALNVVNNLTGGALGSLLATSENPSVLFLKNTGYGQKSVLFKSLDYNIFRPKYNKGLILGVTDAINNLLGANTDQGGGYYVGSDQAEPSQINSPANEIPVDRFGNQQQAPVYGPDTLGKLYEGNDDKIKFGLAGKSYSNQGGITGQFTWVSPKYKDNLGFKVGPGGVPVQPQDQEFDAVKGEFNSNTESTGFEFKGGSILDNTQRLINAADNVTGAKRLQHVGNAINQVSKVFNDGYKEMTKGSQVIAYYDSVKNTELITIDGTEVGREYCRVFQKDTPYLTYADLQKTDGITTSGRRFTNSVLDNTYNLNIGPLRNPNSTNIFDQKVKKYMFSLENLAWRTSSEPGYTYDDLPVCERGPNGGRIMWFPPYDLTFSDSSTANWTPTSFLGRPEPIHTYKNTTRTGSISWKIVVDHPSIMNTIVRKQLENFSPEQVDSIMDSFFAGCVKYDLYDLAAKFNTIPVNQLYEYQKLLADPRLTDEQKYSILDDIPTNPEPLAGGVDDPIIENGEKLKNNTPGTVGANITKVSSVEEVIVNTELKEWEGYSFYFNNDFPFGYGSYATEVPNNQDYEYWYNLYTSSGVKNIYAGNAAPAKVQPYKKNANGPDTPDGGVFTKSQVIPFFDDVIIGNFQKIKNELLPKLKEIIIDKGGTVTLELQGSASAPASVEYNKNLSQRRNDSVKKWFLKQKLGDTLISELQTNGRIKFTYTSSGEEYIIPITNSGVGVGNKCTNDIFDANLGYKTSNSQWYSVPAMVCRRVAINKITVQTKEKPKNPCDDENYRNQNKEFCCTNGYPDLCVKEVQIIVTDIERFECINGRCQKSTNPNAPFTGKTDCENNCGDPIDPVIPPIVTPKKIEPTKKIKEGISKKVLRFLFSECDYFDIIKKDQPMVLASIQEKIKYFSPAFHSTTPEGLNARLTFLNQCVRPGQTIPVIGPDGKPKYNDARNTSFGTPPVLVLRIGDFYHTKIIPGQLSITYDPLIYDINPEGIGVQPMIAKISLSFDFIGGHGLAEPVAQLQNALSFNFYANTEIYDERAVPTESTKEKDEALVKQILSRKDNPPPPIQVTNLDTSNNLPTAGGGTTIGKILSTISFDNGEYEEGEIEYTDIFKELSDKTKNYFTTIFDQLKTINDVTNYGFIQYVYKNVKYFSGILGQHDDDEQLTEIFGKPTKVENDVESIIRQARNDVKDDKNPIIVKVINPNNYPDSAIRQLKNKLIDIITERLDELNEALIGPQNEITKYQENYVQTFRKLDLVNHKIDGYRLDTGKFKVYNLLFPDPVPDPDPFLSVTKNYQTNISYLLLDYNTNLKSGNVLNEEVITDDYNFKPLLKSDSPLFKFSTAEQERFYLCMSSIFTDDAKYQPFVESLMTELVKKNTLMEQDIRSVCEELKTLFVKEKEVETKILTDFETSPAYQTFKNYIIEPFETKMKYSTKKDNNYKDNEKLLKKTYSDNNLDKLDNFNNKITFN